MRAFALPEEVSRVVRYLTTGEWGPLRQLDEFAVHSHWEEDWSPARWVMKLLTVCPYASMHPTICTLRARQDVQALKLVVSKPREDQGRTRPDSGVGLFQPLKGHQGGQ